MGKRINKAIFIDRDGAMNKAAQELDIDICQLDEAVIGERQEMS